MASTRRIPLVKLFVGVLVCEEKPIAPIKDRLTAFYGPIDCESSLSAAQIDRTFFSFERLIEANQLEDITRQSNEIVEETGYLENARLVLTSTNDFYHRIYHFTHDAFQFASEMCPDLNNYQSFFLRIRHIYRSQLRRMCILKREETP